MWPRPLNLDAAPNARPSRPPRSSRRSEMKAPPRRPRPEDRGPDRPRAVGVFAVAAAAPRPWPGPSPWYSPLTAGAATVDGAGGAEGGEVDV